MASCTPLWQIITDPGIPQHILDELRQRGIDVVIVEP